MTIVCRLNTRIERLGVSYRALGRFVGASHNAVARWARGDAFPTVDKALILAEALGTEVENLWEIHDREI
jgi:transcriptional regulator with XRE-family HTH domain